MILHINRLRSQHRYQLFSTCGSNFDSLGEAVLPLGIKSYYEGRDLHSWFPLVTAVVPVSSGRQTANTFPQYITGVQEEALWVAPVWRIRMVLVQPCLSSSLGFGRDGGVIRIMLLWGDVKRVPMPARLMSLRCQTCCPRGHEGSSEP